MGFPRACSRLLLAALLVVGSARPVARADDPAPGEAEFLAALQQAKTTLSAGRATAGLKQLDAALADHARKDYVRAKRPEIEDLVRRLCFRCDCPPPEPQSVVKGKLKKFVSRSGDLEIVYAAGQPTDLEPRGGGLAFPARFRGPFTITVRGDSYPDKVEAGPMVQVGMEANPKTRKVQTWGVSFGVPPYDAGARKIWLPARILYLDGEEKKTVVEKATTPAEASKPYRLDVSVTPTRVTGSVNGTSIGSAPKPDGVFGYAMVQVANWSEIVVSGQVEPSWIEAKIDAIVETKRRAFEAKFDLHDHLPAWLYEKPAPSSTPAAPAARPTVSARGLPPALATEYAAALVLLRVGDFDGALAAAQALREKGAPDGVTGVLAAQALVGLEEATKALVEADRAIAADPDAFDAVLLRARLLLRLGRDEELATSLEAAAARPQAGREVFEAAAFLLLLAGRLDSARAVTEDATRRGQHSEGLERIRRVIVTAKNGPDWPKSYEYKSANYHVVSDIDVDTCRKASQVLEDALVEYRVHVRTLKAGERRQLYKVYLFSGREGFLRYVSDASVLEDKLPEQVAGLYSPILKQLMIWNLPNRDAMMRTVRHEGFHQYLDRLLPDPPVWFNEGLAVYYEAMQNVGGEIRTDKPRFEYLEALKGKPLVPLASFLRIRPKEFYATAPQSYAQAWLLVHMMRHGVGKHRDLYRGLLSRLETATGPEAVRAVFDEAALPALDDDLRAYLDAMAAKK